MVERSSEKEYLLTVNPRILELLGPNLYTQYLLRVSGTNCECI